MALTQQQINAQRYNLRNKYIKIELLDDTLKPIDSLEGTAVSGSITANANNDIRYSGSITLAIPTHRTAANFLEQNEGYTVTAGGKIWLDKRLRIYVGIKNPQTGEIVWTNLGIYYIDKPVRDFSASEYAISFDCADQMLKLSGARQGQLTGITTVIPKGEYSTPKVDVAVGNSLVGAFTEFDQKSKSNLGMRYANVLETDTGYSFVTQASVSPTLFATSGGSLVDEYVSGAVTTSANELFVQMQNYTALYKNNDLTTATKIDMPSSALAGGISIANDIVFVHYANPNIGGLYFDTNTQSFQSVQYSTTTAHWQDIAYGGTVDKCYLVTDRYSLGEQAWKMNTNFPSGAWVDAPSCNGDSIGVDKKTGAFFAYARDSTTLYRWTGPNSGSSTWESFTIRAPKVNTNGNGIGGIAFGDNINVSISEDSRYITTFDGDGNITEYDLQAQGITDFVAETGVSYMYGMFFVGGNRGILNEVPFYIYSADGIHWEESFGSLTRYTREPTAINTPFNGTLISVPSYFTRTMSGYQTEIISTLEFIGPQSAQTIYEYSPKTNTPSWTDIVFPADIGTITAVGDSYSLGLFNSYCGIYTTLYTKTKTIDALYSVVQELGGINNFAIYPMPDKYKYLPYDIKVEVGATVLDILKKFMDILGDTWQMFFDRDTGIFKIEPKPSGQSDPIYEINEAQKITDQQSADFQNVKNQVVVYGRLNTLSVYTDNDTAENSVVYDGSTLKLTYSAINTSAMTVNGFLFGFKTPAQYNPTLNKLEVYVGTEKKCEGALVTYENTQPFVQADAVEPNEIYAIRIFDGTLNADNSVNLNMPIIFDLYSKQQVSWTLVDDNKESPYYINGNLDEPNYYGGLTRSATGQNFALTLNNSIDLPLLLDGSIVTFMANQTNLAGCTFDIYSAFNPVTPIVTGAKLKQDIFNSDGVTRPDAFAGKISNDYTIWKMRYESANNYFVLLGRNEKVLTQVFSGGEYDNIYADALALDRCKYELFLHSNLQNQISLGIVPDYVLDVNMRIPYRDSVLFNPANLYSQFNVQNATYTNTDKFVTSDGNNFMVETVPTGYYLTQTVEYPLGVSNSPQTITATQIYDNKNLLGDDYLYHKDN